MGDMMYGAIGIGGIAVFASFISRNVSLRLFRVLWFEK